MQFTVASAFEDFSERAIHHVNEPRLPKSPDTSSLPRLTSGSSLYSIVQTALRRHECSVSTGGRRS